MVSDKRKANTQVKREVRRGWQMRREGEKEMEEEEEDWRERGWNGEVTVEKGREGVV